MNNSFDNQDNNQQIENNENMNQKIYSGGMQLGNQNSNNYLDQSTTYQNSNNYLDQSTIYQNSNNIYQTGNNFNQIKPKKFNVVYLIIPLIILVAAVIAYFVFFNNGGESLLNDSNMNLENSSTTNNESNWDDYILFIDGKKIKLPMKFSDFQALGFYEMTTNNGSVLTELCDANSNCGTTYNSTIDKLYGLFTNGKTSNIELVIFNPFNDAKQIKDCYITKVTFKYDYRTMDYFKYGEVKILNNTKKIEAIVGKTKYEDIESTFGLHYQYDFTNTLTYYPDLKADGVIGMDDLSFDRSLHLYFDNETRIFEAIGLEYYDTGDFLK